MKYTIERTSWFDEKGVESNERFYVKHRKSFLGLFSYWKYVTHLTCGWGDCHNVRTSFMTEAEAIKFTQDLCKGMLTDQQSSSIVNSVECNEPRQD